MKFNTKTIHGGQSPDKAYGSVMPPIYQTSTYAQTTPGGHKVMSIGAHTILPGMLLKNLLQALRTGITGWLLAPD